MRALAFSMGLATAVAACSGSEDAGRSARGRAAACPEVAEAPAVLPRVRPEHGTMAYWVERAREQSVDMDQPLLIDGGAPSGGATDRAPSRRTIYARAFHDLDAANPPRTGAQLVHDLLEPFGATAVRARQGTFSIDLAHVREERDRGLVIDEAHARGLVLIELSAEHTLLYLGRSREGARMAMHVLDAYREPCAGGGETSRTVGRLVVTDLDLGRGARGGSLLAQARRLVVIGGRAGEALAGVARYRAANRVAAPPDAAASCEDSPAVRIFVSPARPHTQTAMRIIVTSSHEIEPVELALFDRSGARHEVDLHRLGGPPFALWTRVDAPAAGTWTAVLGDGARVEACRRISVARDAELARRAAPTHLDWGEDTENLYAAFIEQLFDYPIDEEVSWPNLQEVLRVADKNILFDHLGLGEDAALALQPDCADLPYYLRAYFTYKLGLPFAYRHCSRGREHVAPRCGAIQTNASVLAHAGGDDEIPLFRRFVVRDVGWAVHSATARTLPNDDETDLYTVPLSRAGLSPGTVYADPYGHTMVVSRWVAQGADRYGIMMAVDAQPDGTIGRRRFWRGNFLFTPVTEDVGSGFKRFRPLIASARSGAIRALDNAEIARHPGLVPWSDEQYRGSADDFYARVEALVNPRPLEPMALLVSLMDALEEAVVRRVEAVQNGETYMTSASGAVVPMPRGYDVFETAGPWEDYATPSRDMRLLIAIDTVLALPDRVQRAPEQFRLSRSSAIGPLVESLRRRMRQELSRRRFRYVRSNGAPQELTLADVLARSAALEVAYNPNDCIEHRWGAPEGSPERTTCARHAPEDQRARMEQYRVWFHERRRPAR